MENPKLRNSGLDEHGAEHLRYAHPLQFIYLKLLFCSLLNHRYVPESFGLGICAPLLKDKTGNVKGVDNYGAIAL